MKVVGGSNSVAKAPLPAAPPLTSGGLPLPLAVLPPLTVVGG